jgi:hypothetical protein
METVFSVGSVSTLHNEDPRPAERIIEGVSWDGNGKWLRRDGNELVALQKCGYEKKTSCVLQLQWDWYNYCVEIRCQDATNEDWET